MRADACPGLAQTGTCGTGAAASAAVVESSLALPFELEFEFAFVEYECDGGAGMLALILFGRLGNDVNFFNPRLSLLEGVCFA